MSKAFCNLNAICTNHGADAFFAQHYNIAPTKMATVIFNEDGSTAEKLIRRGFYKFKWKAEIIHVSGHAASWFPFVLHGALANASRLPPSFF